MERRRPDAAAREDRVPATTVPTRTRVGILVIRRRGTTEWQPWAWHVVAIVPAARHPDWTRLLEVDGAGLFYATALELALDAAETGEYRRNLEGASPSLFVVSRSLAAAGEAPPLSPVHVTASADEAQAHAECGDDLVDAVAMPIPVAAWIMAFVDEHRAAPAFVRRRGARPAGTAARRAGPIVLPAVYRPPGGRA